MANVGSLVVDLRANSAAFIAEMEKGRAATERLGRTTETIAGRMQGAFALIGRAAAAAGIALSVQAIIDSGTRAVQAAGGLTDLAEQLGLTVRAYQELRAAALTGGVSVEQFESGMARFSDRIGNANRGTREAVESFSRLGVNILDAAGNLRPTEAILANVADALAAIENPAARAAAANDLFGLAGARLLPILSQGAAGLALNAEQANALGLVLDQNTTEATKRLADQWAVMDAQMQNWKARTALAVIEGLSRVRDYVVALAEEVQRRFPGLLGTPVQAATAAASTLREQLAAVRQEMAAIQTPGPNQPRGAALPARLAFLRQREAALDEQVRNAEAAAAAARERARVLADTENFQNPAGGARAPQGARNPAITAGGRAAAADREAEAFERLQRSIDPAYRAIREFEDAQAILDERFNAGAISAEQHGEMVERLAARYNDAVKGADALGESAARSSDRMRDINQAARDLGLTFESAFESAIVKGESLRSVLGGILSDLARMAIRFAVTNPLANVLQQAVGQIFGGGGSSAGASSSSSRSAFGNVLTPRGPLALAGGGIVSGPHVALIGEGAMNEAVVPLPDGRSIPVELRGGGGTIIINVDARGAEPGAAARLQAVADQIVARAVAAVPMLARAGGQYARDIGARKR